MEENCLTSASLLEALTWQSDPAGQELWIRPPLSEISITIRVKTSTKTPLRRREPALRSV